MLLWTPAIGDILNALCKQSGYSETMPDTNIIITLGVLAVAMIFFVIGKLRVDLVALCVLLVLLLAGQISADQALYGFANPATATVAAMFVLSAGLVRTGLVEWLA